MQCEACRERLAALLEASLSEPERREVESHLDACAGCRRARAELTELDRLLGLVPSEEPVPADLTRRILESARAERRPVSRPRPLVRSPFAWATAAAVLITAVLTWVLARPGGPGGDTPHLPPPGPRSVSARLHVNHTVGRLPSDVTFRLYGPTLGRLFTDLSLLRVTPALSWNNLALIREASYREVTADENGCFRLDQPLGTGAHLAHITRPGHLAAWGVIEPAAPDTVPDLDAVLYPATDLVVSGTVRDTENGRPLAGAVVATPDGTGVLVSNARGEFHGILSSVPGRPLRIYAFAPGHAEARVMVSAAARRQGTFRVEISLPRAERHDLAITVVDRAGTPVAAAQVFARPDLNPTERAAFPALRRDRPEVGVTDEAGRVTLAQLLSCRYRLEVRHAGLDLTRERYADPRDGEPVRLDVRPAGDARVRVTVHDASGRVRPEVRVVLAHYRNDGGRARILRVREGVTDLGGTATFTDLRAGRASVQVFTEDGVGRHLTFFIERGDVVPVDYRIAPAALRLRGTLAPAIRGRHRVLRIEGDLPRVQTGRHPSVSHRLAVEVSIGENGQFVFPPLPRLRNVVLMGRLTADPERAPEPLRSRRPSLKEVFEEEGPGDRTIEVVR